MASTAEVARTLIQQVGDQAGTELPAELVIQLALVNAVLAVADQLELLRGDLASR
jgi:hypothetical protein